MTIFKYVLFNDFESMLLQALLKIHFFRLAVKEIAERIEKLSQLDRQRRQEREQAILIDFTRSNLIEQKRPNKETDRKQMKEKISEYDQFRKPSKLKQKIEVKPESKLLPPIPSQPLPKLPSEYEQFRKPVTKKHQQQQQQQQLQQQQQQSNLVNNFKNPMAKPHPTEYNQVF